MAFQRHRLVQSGFTVFELIIVMLIVGILAAVGTSSFRYVSASNRIAAEINALLADMRYARTEAIKEGLFVTVCASADGATCSKTGPWQNGWIVISDPTGTQTPSGSPLHIQPALSTAYNYSTDQMIVDNSFWAVTFNRQGFGSTNITNVANTVTMALRTNPENTAWTRCLAISPVGLLSIQQNLTGNCT
jgi:type IV fimbrial biogenesis protein FimT